MLLDMWSITTLSSLSAQQCHSLKGSPKLQNTSFLVSPHADSLDFIHPEEILVSLNLKK